MKQLLISLILLSLFSFTVYSQSSFNYSAIHARHIGPALKSGRITDLEAHPLKENILFVGTAGGGVWKSVDAGINFSPVFDNYCQSIGTITVDPNDPDGTIWVGTGETWTRNSTSVGCGIYKSIDGGKSWKLKGLENSERISDIIVLPGNSNVIYVGVLGALWGDSSDRGIYKSSDGGDSWEKIFYVNGRTGCSDLIMDPQNNKIMYAGFWEFRRQPWNFTSGGYSSGLYKTIDGGKTWNKLQNGFPQGKLGRIAVALAPSNPDILYSVVEAEKNSGLYRSDDKGEHWKFLNGDFALTVRPFYFSRIVVDPSNPDIVIKAGLQGAISRDGGKRFKSIGAVHSDVHDILFNKNNPGIVYVATDGGVYRSLDKAANFDFVDNIPVAQFYDISIDDKKPFNVYGGLQDNGSWYGPSETYDGGIRANKWTGVGGGDGFRVFKHNNKDIIYSEMQSGEGIWRYNQQAGDIKVVKPYAGKNDVKLRFNWNTALALSPHNPDRIYIGSQYLHVSDNMGDTWRKISPDLTTNDPDKLKQDKSGGLSIDNSGAENHCTIFTIAESPLDENIIWVGTDDGNLQVTKNGGRKWKNVVKSIPCLPHNTWCYQVLPGKYDKKTAYVVFDGHTLNDKIPYVFKTTNLGKTWISLSNDDIKTFCRTIAEDVESKNILYLGTEMGLYISLDSGKHWDRFDNNVPPVAIHKIVQDEKSGALVLGTHGRGVIIIDNISLLRQLNDELLHEKLTFLNTAPFIMPEKSSFYSGGNDFTEFKGENPNRNALFAYYMKKRHVFGKMQMKIVDEAGNEIIELVPPKSKGLNIVYWNYKMKAPKVPKGKTWATSGFIAPRVKAGKYKVILTKGKEKYEYPFEVQYDSESIYTDADRQLQYKTTMKLYDMLQKLAYLVFQIDEFKKYYTLLSSENKNVLKEIFNNTEKLRKTLVITTGDNYVGTAEPQLREKISKLYADIANYYGAPTSEQMENLKYLEARFFNANKRWMKIKSSFEKSIEKNKFDEIKFKSFTEFVK